MNPIKLLRETDHNPAAVACGKCGQHWSLLWPDAERIATLCCDAGAREAEREARDAASAAAMAQQEAARLAAARRVPEAEYDGAVFCDGLGDNDGYFMSPPELRGWCKDEGVALPAEVWGCYAKRFALPCADEVVSDACESGEHHDSIEDHLTDTADLQDAIDRWNARQPTSACTYYPDYGTRVVLSPESSA